MTRRHATAPIRAASLALALLVACSPPPSNPPDDAAASDRRTSADRSGDDAMPHEEMTVELDRDVDALTEHVELPIRPTDVAWSMRSLGNPGNPVPGPTDWRLDAVLSYAPADAEAVVDKLGGAAAGRARSLALEAWWPEEVRTAAGESERLAVVEYPATALLRPPFTQGTLSRIDGSDRFLLTLLSF